GTQEVGDLGTVVQRWSELGAAARVSLAVGGASFAVLALALAAAALLLAAVQLSGIPTRRAQAAVMRELGFTRARIARWFAGEEVPGIALIVVVAGVAVVSSGGTALVWTTAAIVAATVTLAGLVGVVAGSRHRTGAQPRDARSRRLGARSAAGFGARQALVHPFTTGVHALSLIIVGLAAAALVAAVSSGRADAGRSSLAEVITGGQALPQAALGASGILGGILLARLTRRLDLTRRARQWDALRAAGWTTRQLALAQRVEGAVIVVPVLVVTGVLAALGAHAVGAAPALTYAGIAVAAATVTALVAFSARTRMKGVRP
ncbi:MAG: hypothetical protein QM677_09845, partial [Microbacterium sp.]